jgi:hypothetical protein
VVLLSGTQEKTNNTTCFIHLWPLPLQGSKHLISVVSPYKPWTRGPLGPTLDHMSLPQTHGLGLFTHFIAGPHLRFALSHILTWHSTSALLPEPERNGFTPPKVVTGVSLVADQASLLPSKYRPII